MASNINAPPSLENENAPIKCTDFESNIEAFEILDEPNLEKLLKICQAVYKRQKPMCQKFYTNLIKIKTEKAK